MPEGFGCWCGWVNQRQNAGVGNRWGGVHRLSRGADGDGLNAAPGTDHDLAEGAGHGGSNHSRGLWQQNAKAQHDQHRIAGYSAHVAALPCGGRKGNHICTYPACAFVAQALGPYPMKILFLGDVMGRAGRAAISERLPKLRDDWKLDFVVVNGENATSGNGLSVAHAKTLLEAGADCITLGDHAFDQKDMLSFIDNEPRIIRPLNYAKGAPGRGHRLYTAPGGRKILVAQVLGQVFMKRPFDDPFSAIDQVLKAHPLGGLPQAILVDMHCEATSEKMAMGHWCDGRASVVVGTHTHVPTGDAQILSGGAAYLTDAGMCGDYNSVIGMDKAEPMRRFITGMPKARFTPADGEATLSGVYVETDDRTGHAKEVRMIRDGGRLQQAGV